MTATTPKYMAVQAAAIFVGAGLLILGVCGFLPGVTTGYDRLTWAGEHSGAEVFGLFAVSALHNMVHLVTGALGFVMAHSYAAARAYLLGGALVYLVLWGHGLFIEGAANWLHFGLAAVMMLLGLTLAGQRDPTKRRGRVRA
ncbi:DUF4383 domain-containing protein [Mycolicibacterium pulveris]|uniref:DUF4383 domain-containing protein n=1 Tax=Mycolicibacterium pulveris TaxID=36813 RepID=UPI003CEF727A